MRLWLLAALLFATPAVAQAQTRPRDAAMDAVVRDLCPRQLAMLGEASHGDGATFAFKAELIRRLVTECRYDAVLFEASHYDFVELMRRLRLREEATPAMLSSAIGDIWNRYAELTPLIGFLFERAQAGRLTLGGLDDRHPGRRWKRWRWPAPPGTLSTGTMHGWPGSAACRAGHSSTVRRRPTGRGCSTAWSCSARSGRPPGRHPRAASSPSPAGAYRVRPR